MFSKLMGLLSSSPAKWEELVAMLALGALLAEQPLVPAALALVGTVVLILTVDTGVSL